MRRPRSWPVKLRILTSNGSREKIMRCVLCLCVHVCDVYVGGHGCAVGWVGCGGLLHDMYETEKFAWYVDGRKGRTCCAWAQTCCACTYPLKKLLVSGVSTPCTFCCLIATIHSELQYFPIFTHLRGSGSISAGFQWTGSTPTGLQEAFVRLCVFVCVCVCVCIQLNTQCREQEADRLANYALDFGDKVWEYE